jgi:pyruvate dehydrogenase E1 component alpha subunit
MSKLPIDRDTAQAMLLDMLRIRHLEEKSAEKYTEGKIRGFLHLYIGEEAVATGVARALQPVDNVLGTYREHGHALLRGISADRIMAEMFGKAHGCSGGRGGSMHLFDVEKRFFGGNAIVAGHLPLAAGLALADKMQGRPRVTVCFFGEGAMAEGAFHETMNLAALWKVPALFVCENNLYAMGTALTLSQAQTDLCAKAACHNVPARSVDGMDVLAVFEAATEAVAQVRAGNGPYFLECRTYRFRAHSMFDAELYRPKTEVEKWKKRDPIKLFVEKLRAADLLDDETYQALAAKAEAEMEASVAFAESAPWEPLDQLTKHVYAREADHG